MAGHATAENQPASPVKSTVDKNLADVLPADASADQILDALDVVGQDLQAFDAEVQLIETDNATMLSTANSGKVWFQNRKDGNARLRVTFDKKEVNGQVRNDKLEYLLENGWLAERDYSRRIQINRQVLRPGEKMELLKLGEGPFPLPIGQNKEDVHQRFAVKKIEAREGDPANTLHLELTPKPDTQFARKFSVIDVWVDRRTHMPRRIETLDKNETMIRTTELSNIRVNPALADSDFTLPPIDEKNWSIRDEMFNDS